MTYKSSLYFLFVLMILFASFASCKNDKSKDPEHLSISNESIPVDFINFYNQFHTDTSFQINRIMFPLKGLPTIADSTTNHDNYTWSKDSWQIHKPFNDHNGTYIRALSNFHGIIGEKIYEKGRRFEMNRRFAKIGGVWHLIYYAAMRPVATEK